MQVSISIGNYKTIVGQIQGKIDTLKAKAGNAVQGAGINCEAGAKQRCPVDTGRLRASIKYTKITEYKCTVGTNVYYGFFVEHGHRTRSGSTVAPRPFLFPSYLEAKKQLIEELKALIV